MTERGEEREKERERNIGVREIHQLVASYTHPHQGLNPQPRHVPWPGIEPQPFLVCHMTAKLWHTSQGHFISFFNNRHTYAYHRCGYHDVMKSENSLVCVYIFMIMVYFVLHTSLWVFLRNITQFGERVKTGVPELNITRGRAYARGF